MRATPLVLTSVFALACASSSPPPNGGGAKTSSTAAQPNGPPVARVEPVTDTYWGQAVVDPYRWMETDGSPELASWMKGQADHTKRVLEALPERRAMFDRIRALDTQIGDRMWNLQVWGTRWFYLKRPVNADVAKLFVREGAAGAERLLLDPETLNADGKHVSLDWYVGSPDGSLVAYGLSPSGSENSVLHVLETATGKVLPDALDRAQFGGVSWLDAKTFAMTRLQKLGPDSPPSDRYKKAAAQIHVLGADPEKELPIIGCGLSPDVTMREEEIGGAWATPSAPKWIFGFASDGVRNEQTVYFASRSGLAGPKTKWKKLFDALADEVTNFDVKGDDLYFLTHKGAPRSKIMKLSLAKPDVAKASVVVPETTVVIQSLGIAKDALYLTVLDGGIERIQRVAFTGGKVETTPLPVDGSLVGMSTHPDRPGVITGVESWIVSRRFLQYDPAKKVFTDTGLLPPSPADMSNVEAIEVKVKSKDGTEVPLSIRYQKGIAKDGSHPTWLSGYGAYGVSQLPFFGPKNLTWMERGGIHATCHVRGGGEYGEGWHKDGMLLKKQNTIDDFLACAHYLIDQKLTSPAHLAGEGTSAGGILIGGAITQEPALFGAALIRVGISNALRFENTTNVLNVPEFGSVKTEDGFKGLLAMDAYSHVKDQTAYPAVLLTTGVTDPRVAPWQVAKMAARLQAATSSKKPVLLRVEYEGGHGLGSTATQFDTELADTYAFLLANLR